MSRTTNLGLGTSRATSGTTTGYSRWTVLAPVINSATFARVTHTQLSISGGGSTMTPVDHCGTRNTIVLMQRLHRSDGETVRCVVRNSLLE
jgi:hypothetical protein